jgi:hypothetical protein
MFRKNFLKSAASLAVLLFCVLAIWQPLPAFAQAEVGPQELKLRAADLIKEQKYTEALPILQKLAIAEPENARTQFYLGFASVGIRMESQQ